MRDHPNAAPGFELVLQPYGAVLLDPTGRVSYLNDTAAAVCLHLAAGRSDLEIAHKLSDGFDVSLAEASDDARLFIQSLPSARELAQATVHVSGSSERLSAYEADIALTLRCNLRCKYCYACAGVPPADELTSADWIRAASQLLQLGLRKATVAGGEPLLSEACLPLVRLLRDHDVCVQLFTNGMFVTDDIASQLRDLQLNFVQVSLDATTSELHDRYRGRSFHRALDGLRRLVSADVPVVIGANIFPDTLDEVDRLARLAESLGVGLRCNAIEARGRGAGMVDVSVANSSVERLINDRVRVIANRHKATFVEQHFSVDKDRGDMCCPFARGSIAVNSAGRVRLCSQSEEYFERVAPWSLDPRPIWELHCLEQHCAFPTIGSIPATCRPTDGNCGSCEMFGICSGCLPAGLTCTTRKEPYDASAN